MTNNIVPYTVKKIMDIVVSIIFKFWLPFPTHTFLSSLNAINKILEFNKSHVHHKSDPRNRVRRGMKGGCAGARVSHGHAAHTNYPWRASGAAAAYKQPLDRAGAAAVNKQPPGALQTVTCATLLTLVAISPTAASTFILYVRRILEEQHCTESK